MDGSTPPSLSSVIESLPQECYENPTWKGVLWLARDWILYGAALALLVWTDHPLLLVPAWIVTALCISGLFILGHDAAHGALFKSSRLNYVLGQLAMLPSLHLYEAWVFGHNRIHHGHTTRQVMDYVWHPLTPDQYSELSSLGKLGHRIKWSALGAGIYYLQEIWWQKMIRFTPSEKMESAVRRDRIVVGSYAAVVSVLVLGLGAAQYGTFGGALWMWAKLLGIPFILWNYVIGWAVYVHHISPEIRWHRRREWTKVQGQLHGTTILYAPRWLNFFMHNIFLHVPHHVDMRIPFYGLPVASEALLESYGDQIVARRFPWKDYWRATRTCKLFDFENGVWCSYPTRA